MTSREFGRLWLQQHGLFDADSDYNGGLGLMVLEVWNTIANQGHTGMSAAALFALLNRIKADYDNGDSPIWQEYWSSAEGQALKAQFEG